jgi:solute carrier family 25, member 39/40
MKTMANHSLSRQILASSMGSIASTLTLNPIAVVKVRLQNGAGGTSKHPLQTVIRNVLAERGIGGFWSGTPMGIFMSVPNTVLYMSAYEALKEEFTIHPVTQSVQPIVPAIAGALARMVAVTMISPLEMIRTIQTGGVRDSISAIAKKIVAERGVLGLYSGWGSSVLRDCPFSAIYWLGFESLRPLYGSLLLGEARGGGRGGAGTGTGTGIGTGGLKPQVFPSYITFLSGASAGMVAAVCTHPFDVLKTQLQVGAYQNSSSTSSSTSSSSSHHGIGSGASNSSSSSSSSTSTSNSSGSGGFQRPTLVSIFRAGGTSALFRGLTMRLATVIPASAIMVTIYESIKKLDI